MARSTRHGAYHRMLNRGPWVPGSCHGYHKEGTDNCDKHPNEGWRHTENGKYGQGYRHCIFCCEDFPFHSEFCAWYDFFHAWNQVDPMEVEYGADKGKIPMGCRPEVHGIEE